MIDPHCVLAKNHILFCFEHRCCPTYSAFVSLRLWEVLSWIILLQTQRYAASNQRSGKNSVKKWSMQAKGRSKHPKLQLTCTCRFFFILMIGGFVLVVLPSAALVFPALLLCGDFCGDLPPRSPRLGANTGVDSVRVPSELCDGALLWRRWCCRAGAEPPRPSGLPCAVVSSRSERIDEESVAVSRLSSMLTTRCRRTRSAINCCNFWILWRRVVSLARSQSHFSFCFRKRCFRRSSCGSSSEHVPSEIWSSSVNDGDGALSTSSSS